jgi:uncharacterized repeat protein (TIGR03806 family)
MPGLKTNCLLIACLLVGCGQGTRPVVLHPEDNPPARLSDWGIVLTDARDLVLNDGVTAYTLNTPLFSDYAQKLRTIWMPNGKASGYRSEGPFDFPLGTIVSKTFYYPKASGSHTGKVLKSGEASQYSLPARLNLDEHLLVETRLLIRYEQGWKALPYVWNPQQDEALLAITGDLVPLEFPGDVGDELFDYVVPDINQCAACHVTDHGSKSLRPLGPTAWQLNRIEGAGASAVDQLDSWVADGLLQGLPDSRPSGVDWTDAEHTTLDARVRAYLDSNCAHCHNPAGAADTSALNLVADNRDDRSFGICKPPVAVGRGSGDRPYDIFPGEPGRSILLYRMQETAPEIAMPELGRSTVHTEAVDLVSEWIAQMKGSC